MDYVKILQWQIQFVCYIYYYYYNIIIFTYYSNITFGYYVYGVRLDLGDRYRNIYLYYIVATTALYCVLYCGPPQRIMGLVEVRVRTRVVCLFWCLFMCGFTGLSYWMMFHCDFIVVYLWVLQPSTNRYVCWLGDSVFAVFERALNAVRGRAVCEARAA